MLLRALLFDLDNTLLLEDDATEAALASACARATGRGLDPPALRRAARREAESLWRDAPTFTYADAMGISPWEGLWGEFAGDDVGLRALRAWAPTYRRETWRRALASLGVADGALADELADAFRAARRARHPVDPDAGGILDELAREHALGLVTNGAPDVQREKLAGTDLAHHFSVNVVSAEVGVGKPDPRIFEIALRALGVRAQEAAMVGDSLERDVAGARRAGLRAIWIDRGSQEHARSRVVPDVRIERLSELPAAVVAAAPGVASPRGSRAPRRR